MIASEQGAQPPTLNCEGGEMNFVIIGAAGYVAPRHMEAIKAVGGRIVAVLDPSDSVGVLDSYGYDISYFREFERFERHIDLLQSKGTRIDYVVVCSPNYLHDSHIRFGLRIGANVICEKPLVLNPWNLDSLERAESESEGKVYTVLQLRYHPEVAEAKQLIERSVSSKDVVLRYYTPRGLWYHYSWKGIESESGGILMNIGIHLFDLMLFMFGDVKYTKVAKLGSKRSFGRIGFDLWSVYWDLSIEDNRKPIRSMWIDYTLEMNFTKGFAELHSTVYKEIVGGRGYGINDARPSIELVNRLKGAKL